MKPSSRTLRPPGDERLTLQVTEQSQGGVRSVDELGEQLSNLYSNVLTSCSVGTKSWSG